MTNTVFTIFLFGLPLAACIFLWRTLVAVIKRLWPAKSSVQEPGCLNFITVTAMGIIYFALVALINRNYVTSLEVTRDDKGKIVYERMHYFAPGMNIDGEPVPEKKLVNNIDKPLYVYSETYGAPVALGSADETSTYVVTCPPGQSIPLLMHIDYYFRHAPRTISTKDKTSVQTRWVLDSAVPYNYVIPIAPNSPLITGPDSKS